MEIIAHRGMHNDRVKENSYDAISHVLASVADGIEIDVQLTRDNICVIYHNDKTPEGKSISEIEYRDLKNEEPHVTTFQEALAILEKYEGIINIEVKHNFGGPNAYRAKECIEKISQLIDIDNKQNYIFSSFTRKNLKYIRQNIPQAKIALLIPPYMPNCFGYFYAKKMKCEALHLSSLRTKLPFFKTILKSAQKHGLKVRIYTVNKDQDYIRLKTLGTDAIFTDKVIAMDELRLSIAGKSKQ